MKHALTLAFGLVLALASGCASVDDGSTPPWLPGGGVTKTFAAPVARVKPAFITTLTQMGMPISALEVRGKNEVIKSRKADKSVEIEIEPVSASSTRVRINGSGEMPAQIMRETEKRIGGG